jgi:hypothetical protein
MYQRLLNLTLAGLLFFCGAGRLSAQYSITALNTPVTENFDGQTATTTATGGTATPTTPVFTLPGLANWQGARILAQNPSGMAPQAYGGTTDGSSGVGGIYNVGATGNSNRMLGTTADGNTAGRFGTRFTNNTGQTITQLQVSFTQAQWRNGTEIIPATGQNEQWQFGYRTTAAADINAAGIWTPLNTLNLTEINTTTTIAAAVDGYNAANQLVKTATITSLSLAPGGTIWFRWSDTDEGLNGGDALMAIDNLTVTAPGPALNINYLNGKSKLHYSPNSSNPSAFQVLNVGGTQLTADITVSIPAPFEGRLDMGETDANYRNTITLARVGSDVPTTALRIRFNPGAGLGLRFAVGTISSGALSRSSVLVGTTAGIGTIRWDQVARLNPAGNQTVRGRISALSNFSPSELTIQDGTGGINVFISNEAAPGTYYSSRGLALGDSIEVTGPLGEFQRITSPSQVYGSGQLQITGNSGAVTLTKLASGSPTFPIIPLTVAGYRDSTTAEAVESMLVGFSNVSVNNQGVATWREEQNYVARDGSIAPGQTVQDSMTLRTTRRTTLFDNGSNNWQYSTIPATISTLAGLGGEFRGADQLRLRRRTDIGGSTAVNYLNATNAAIPTNQTLDVATINLKYFAGTTAQGYFPPSANNPTAQVDSVSELLVALDADLYILQELTTNTNANLITNTGNSASLISRLNTRGTATNTVWGIQIAAGANQDQAVGFVYKVSQGGTAVITSGGTPTYLLSTSVGSNWAIFSGVRRVPVEFSFTYNAGAQGNQSLTAIGLHGKASATVTDYNQRVNSYSEMKTFLDANRASSKLIIGGDWNDLLVGSIYLSTATSPMNNFITDAANYRFLTQNLHTIGAASFAGTGGGMIDHIMVTNDLYPNVLNDATYVVNPFNLNPNYTTTASDHYPVVTRLRFDTALATEQDATDGRSAFDLNVYPNPTAGSLKVSYRLKSDQLVSVNLYDATGGLRQVLAPRSRHAAGDHETQLQLSVSPGLYFVSLETEGGARETRKVVVSY